MSYGWEGDIVVKKWFCMNFSIARDPITAATLQLPHFSHGSTIL